MDARAQVSLEYLLTLGFGVILATIAAIMAFQVAAIAQVAEKNIEQFRKEAILSFLGE